MSMLADLYLKFSDSVSPHKDEGQTKACIANISPQERKKRLNFAIQYFVFTILILGLLLYLHVDPLWRLPLFFMFAASGSSFFQWRDKT